MIRKPCLIGVLLALLSPVPSSRAGIVPVDSISEITAGTTIDFEEPGLTIVDILSPHRISFTHNYSGRFPTTFVNWVTGNDDAPIAGHAIAFNFEIATTGKPWGKIGITGVGTQVSLPLTLTLRAYDEIGLEIGNVTRDFVPGTYPFGDWQQDYNDAAVFLGLHSSIPIYYISTESSDPNVAWDNLSFSSVIPEPHSICLLLVGLLGVCHLIRHGG